VLAHTGDPPDFNINYYYPGPTAGKFSARSYQTTKGTRSFNRMRISQTTGYLYICNLNTTYYEIEFLRLKHGPTLNKNGMYSSRFNASPLVRCLDIDFRPGTAVYDPVFGNLLSLTPEPQVYFTAYTGDYIIFYEV
jgi:hypothetical protein